MAKRGRKPKSLALHDIEGTRRAHHKGSDLNPGDPLGECPDHLDELGGEFWDWAAGQYTAMRINPADPISLAGMADMYSRWRHAVDASPAGGFYVCKKTGNPKRHPAAIEAMQALKELRLMMSSNGLNMEGWVRESGQAWTADDEFFDGPRLAQEDDWILGKGLRPPHTARETRDS